MSIVPLKKATIYAPETDQKELLQRLQEEGFLHLIPLSSEEGAAGAKGVVTPESKEALKFLLQTPNRRKQFHEVEEFHAEHIKSQALHLKARLKELEEEREVLKKRIIAMRPWGDFRLPPKDALGNLRLWFYMVPHNRVQELKDLNLVWYKAGKDHRFVYVVAISETEPLLDFERTHTGIHPLSAYVKRLEIVESELEDAMTQRVGLTKWIDLYTNDLYRLEDQEALKAASETTYRKEGLLVIQGWFPVKKEKQLQAFCKMKRCALVINEPAEEESPPTLLENQGALASGENLLTFYMTPGYRQYDPSNLFFFSFVLFFGIILGDVGYGTLAGFATLLAWRTMGKKKSGRKNRVLLAALSATTVVWGILTGNYFGAAPEPNSFFGTLHLLHLDDFDTMMKTSITIGASHLILANVMVGLNLYRHRSYAAILAPVGWIAAISTGLIIYLWPPFLGAGQWIAAAGGILILAFSGAGEHGLRRFASGLLSLTRVTLAFGDTLSYLRLFALGLATSSMSIAINGLAEQVIGQFAGVGVLFGFILLFIGHSLNLALGIVSGVVHGLRLNVIEYLNWGMPQEGRPYIPFHKKEQQKWKHL